MKIGVIFTGGTIGSQVGGDGYISTHAQAPFLLLAQYQDWSRNRECEDSIEFILRQPYCVLSENLQGQQLQQLIVCIQDFLEQEKPEGIIVTHGTDTLQYTSAVLGYVFSHVSCPIVLVSSNYVLTDERANGLLNFIFAVEFIKGKYGTGVFVSYCNEGSYPHIHRGTRLMSPLAYSDWVFSIEDSYYGAFVCENGPVEGMQDWGRLKFVKGTVRDERESMPGLLAERHPREIVLSDDTGSIMQMHPFVGMKYPPIPDGTKIILHSSYHSGTIGISEDLKAFAELARERQIPFYLIGLSSKASHYETVKMYEENLILPLFDTAYIAQYCKAWLAVSNHLDIRAVMEQEMAYDHGK